MPSIKFSHDWSKLECPPGSLFTTIRPYNDTNVDWNKARYYEDLEGKILDVEVNGTRKFKAELLQVFRGSGKSLSGPLLKYDTDGDSDWMERVSGYHNCLVLLFRRVAE